MMAKTTIYRLIINSPYKESKHHWRYHKDTLTFSLKNARATHSWKRWHTRNCVS